MQLAAIIVSLVATVVGLDAGQPRGRCHGAHAAPRPRRFSYRPPGRPYRHLGPRGRRSHPDAEVVGPRRGALVRHGRLRGAAAHADRGLRRAVPAAMGLPGDRRQRGVRAGDRAGHADHSGRHRGVDRRPPSSPMRAARARATGSSAPRTWMGYYVEATILADRGVHLPAPRAAGCRRRDCTTRTGRPSSRGGSAVRFSAGSSHRSTRRRDLRRGHGQDRRVDGVVRGHRTQPHDGRGLAPVPRPVQHLVQARGVRRGGAGAAAAAGRRLRGPGGRRGLRRRHDRRLHLEGPARLRDLHRVRALPVAVSGLEHREAAVPQAAHHEPCATSCSPAPRGRLAWSACSRTAA